MATKQALASLACAVGAPQLGRFLQSLRGPYVRAVNYHSVPTSAAAGFEQQLRYYRQHFVDCDPAALEAIMGGTWSGRRPGILITLDDGLADNAEVAAPLLESYGFTGWFCVPTGFIDCPPDRQTSFAKEYHVTAPGAAMSWSQVRRLAERHVIVAHGHRHRRLSAALTEAELREEIILPKLRIEEEIGRPCDAFCWIGGEEWAYSQRAANLIAEAGYRYSFMTNNCPIRASTHPLRLERTNVEADWGMELIRFQLSGLQDLRYLGKRRRLRRLLGAPRGGAA